MVSFDLAACSSVTVFCTKARLERSAEGKAVGEE